MPFAVFPLHQHDDPCGQPPPEIQARNSSLIHATNTAIFGVFYLQLYLKNGLKG